jgi:cysteine-rich secretory family protein
MTFPAAAAAGEPPLAARTEIGGPLAGPVGAAHHPLVSQGHAALVLAGLLAVAALVLLVRHGGRRRRNLLAYGGLLVIAVTAGALLVLLPARTARTASVHVTATESSFVSEINQVRAAHGLRPVVSRAVLLRAARAHSDDMVRGGYFAHGSFWDRLRSFGVQPGDAGEALAWRSSPEDAAPALVQAWLASPEHRAILLDGRYTQVGVGIDEGPFYGYPHAIVVTADFYKPV